MSATSMTSPAAAPRARPAWLANALLTMVLWGVWGAFTGVPAEHGFPETLVYVVWSLTMIPPAIAAMRRAKWRLQRDPGSLAMGLAIGILGAGGQMLLFYAVRIGPTYLVFPIISLSPAITIALSFFLLGERTGKLGALGIALAVASLPLFDYDASGSTAGGYGWWFVLSLGVLVAWGLQAWVIKLANATMDAESIFFWMAASALGFIPVALAMTDFSKPIEWGLLGPWLAALVQSLNAVGALTLVHALRHGQAMVVTPLVNAGAPLLTSLLSMAMAGMLPGPLKLAGVGLALAAALLLALQPESPAPSSMESDR